MEFERKIDGSESKCLHLKRRSKPSSNLLLFLGYFRKPISGVAKMYPDPPNNTLRRFFSGLTECTFQSRLGVADPELLDYISDLLVRFVRFDAVCKIRDLTGRPLTEIAEMIFEAEQRIGDAKREVHRHIGDYALFWSGVYPESLRRNQAPPSHDSMIDYFQQGKRAYLIASSIRTDEENERNAPAQVLERLSHEFELCVYGLQEVRREWENRDGGDSQSLLIN